MKRDSERLGRSWQRKKGGEGKVREERTLEGI